MCVFHQIISICGHFVWCVFVIFIRGSCFCVEKMPNLILSHHPSFEVINCYHIGYLSSPHIFVFLRFTATFNCQFFNEISISSSLSMISILRIANLDTNQRYGISWAKLHTYAYLIHYAVSCFVCFFLCLCCCFLVQSVCKMYSRHHRHRHMWDLILTVFTSIVFIIIVIIIISIESSWKWIINFCITT